MKLIYLSFFMAMVLFSVALVYIFVPYETTARYGLDFGYNEGTLTTIGVILFILAMVAGSYFEYVRTVKIMGNKKGRR